MLCRAFSFAGHFAQATASLYKLRSLLAQQQQQPQQGQQGGDVAAPAAWVAAMLGPDAAWKAEEAKLLWAQVCMCVCVWGGHMS